MTQALHQCTFTPKVIIDQLKVLSDDPRTQERYALMNKLIVARVVIMVVFGDRFNSKARCLRLLFLSSRLKPV
jgi:hypothetical protein